MPLYPGYYVYIPTPGWLTGYSTVYIKLTYSQADWLAICVYIGIIIFNCLLGLVIDLPVLASEPVMSSSWWRCTSHFGQTLLGLPSVYGIITLLLLPIPGIVGEFTLTVLHTNDVHARFEESTSHGSSCPASLASKGQCYGGIARRLTKIQELRSSWPNLLLLDAGDQFQGTLWFYVHKGKAAAYFMNKLKYDAMVSILSFYQSICQPINHHYHQGHNIYI